MDITKLSANIQSFYDPITLYGKIRFNHSELLSKINHYYEGKFLSGDYDSKGARKFFKNITKKACDNATKYIDLDTKDFKFFSEFPNQDERVWVLSHDFTQWMKDTGFAKLLNDISQGYPKEHVVIKKGGDKKWHIVPIYNLFMETGAQTLKESAFVYELIPMLRQDMDDRGWDTTKLPDVERFQVFDCYDRKGKKWEHSVLARVDNGGQYKKEDFDGALEIFSDIKTSLPYRELKWEDIPGRWLGFGIPEYVAGGQVVENDLENMERKGLKFTSLHIWKTRDTNIGNNMLTDVENGDIIKTKDDIVPVDVSEKNLAQYQTIHARMSSYIDSITFMWDANSNIVNSRMPAALMQMLLQVQKSYFTIKRQNFGIFIKELILDDILPSFEKQTKNEHRLNVLRSEGGAEHFINSIIEYIIGQRAYDYAMKSGFYPTKQEFQAEVDRMKGEMMKRKNLSVLVPDGYYSDAKYILSIDATGESIDVATIGQALSEVMQMVNTNPAIIQNPVTRGILFKLLELRGVSPIDIGLFEESVRQESPEGSPEGMQTLQPGGSISTQSAVPQQIGQQQI